MRFRRYGSTPAYAVRTPEPMSLGILVAGDSYPDSSTAVRNRSSPAPKLSGRMLALIALGVALGFVELGFGEPETTLAAGEGVDLAADEPAATVLVPAGVLTFTVAGVLIFGELETTLAAGEGVTLAADEPEETVLFPAGVLTVFVDGPETT